MKRALSILCILLSLSVIKSYADDGKPYLESGLKAYNKDADFDKAVSDLQKAIQLGLTDRADLIQAHLYLGFAYMAEDKRIDAVVEFAKAINLDPSLKLDPKRYSAKIINAFNETKNSLVDSLTVISVPSGAIVYLDGQKMGTTPLKLEDVLASEHTLIIVKDYYQAKTLDIRVEKGEKNRIQVQLDKGKVEVRITSQPEEAFVYISGKIDLSKFDETFSKFQGKTPLSIAMSLDQELSIKLLKEGFLDKELKLKSLAAGIKLSGIEKEITIKDGVADISVSLEQAPASGSLKVSSDPSGAAIYLDGIAKGNTPLSIASVTPGTRQLQASITDFDSMTSEVEIISGRETSVNITMGGKINVSSIPADAQVFIDKKYIGDTPIRMGKAPVGSYQLRLVKEKYRDKIITVSMKREQKEINVRLSPMKGSIYVSSDPPGADIYLDDELKGSTPLFIYGVIIGQYSLKLTKDGYKDWEKNITIEENKVLWCSGRLNQQ